jgi:GGDEF domain-containing protein
MSAPQGLARQAAPFLGNLRNLAIAELRASTDRLTGLPNQRAVQDTLKRMVAQASRTITPLTAVLIDLDHFKQINDLYGHDNGDEIPLPGDAGDSVTLFRAAERALYAAKTAGRDRTHTAIDQLLSHTLVNTANGHDAE